MRTLRFFHQHSTTLSGSQAHTGLQSNFTGRKSLEGSSFFLSSSCPIFVGLPSRCPLFPIWIKMPTQDVNFFPRKISLFSAIISKGGQEQDGFSVRKRPHTL